MYCPSCGIDSVEGLKYCKRCGAGLTTATAHIDPGPPVTKMGTMLFLVSLVSITGFIALFTTVANLSHPGFDPRILIAILAFGGATVVGVIGLLVWLLLHWSGHRPLTSHDKPEKPTALDYTHKQLQSPPISIPSVTENTTRNFDPSVYREKGGRE